MNNLNADIELELREKLEQTESPFKWMPNRSEFEAVDPQYVLKKSIHKIEDDNFYVYLKYMRRAYELGKKDDDASTIQVVEEWEKFLIDKETTDDFFIKTNLALKHVLYSSKANILLKIKNYDEAQTSIEIINQTECKSDHLRAAIFGLKAGFFDSYGSEGHQRALPNAQMAMELDPDEPEWIYLTVKTMRDIRRGVLYNMEGTEQSRKKEVELFEELIHLKQKGFYFIRLGNSYIDLAHYIFINKKYNHRCNRQSRCCQNIQDYFDKGVECFEEGIKIDPKMINYLNAIRGINGIPGRYRNKYRVTTKFWISTILEKDVDDEDKCDISYAIGKYYQHVEKNDSEAVKYFKRAAELGSLNAKKDLIRMRFDVRSEIYEPHESPEKELLEVMETYPDRPKKIECLCQLASYYLFIKNDLLKVTELILREKENDPGFTSLYLREHKSWFNYPPRWKKHQDLLNQVYVKVSRRLEELGGEEESEEKKKLSDFKNIVTETIDE